MIKFSIIIPTYNRIDKLRRAVNSVLQQTYSNYEILVIDDGSTDSTQKEFSNFNLETLRYICIENSGGPAKPRNIGVNNSTGDWIAFLDSDDYWLPNKLEVISNEIKNNQFDVICHNEFMLDGLTGNKRINIYGPAIKDMYKYLLYCGNRLSTSATAVKSSFIKNNSIKFDEDSKYLMVEDYDYWLSIALKRGSFKFIKDVLGVYDISNDSLTKNILLNQINLGNVLEKHITIIGKINYLEVFKKFQKIKTRRVQRNKSILVNLNCHIKFISYKLYRYLYVFKYFYKKII